MTSFAFILGVVPMLVATGAGSEMRRSLGTAVFSGMLGVTVFGIFLTPVFFYVIQGLSQTHLFRAVATQWIGSFLMGALLGGGIGFALARVGLGDPLWGPAIGGAAGVLGGAVLQAVHWHVSNGARKTNGGEQPDTGEQTELLTTDN